MKKALFILSSLFAIMVLVSSCKYEKVYYHSRNGRVKHARAKKTPPWFYTKERGYNKDARRTMRRWDRGFR